jgi:hypothetical protein
MPIKWTPIEVAVLEVFYPIFKTETLMHIFNKSKLSIYQKAQGLGFKKCEALVKVTTLQSALELAKKGESTRFSQKQEPWNKGIKIKGIVSEKAWKRMEKTFYPKGNLPHNTKHDGAISIRHSKGTPYKYIRLSQSNWVLLHRHLWEQQNGPIPAGNLIRFIDGNSLNCDIENLQLISMKQNLIKNQIHDYPSEIKETIKLKNKLIKPTSKAPFSLLKNILINAIELGGITI